MVEQHAGDAIHVRERVLRLAVFPQYAWRDVAGTLHELEDGILGDFGAGGGEFHEGLEAGVGFAQDGVSVAGDYLVGIQGRPEVLFDGVVGEGGADVGLHFQDPAEDFLCCETVELALASDETGRLVKHTHAEDQQGLATQRCS